MKRLLTILFCIVSLASFGAVTNYFPVTYDTNTGVIHSPANFKAANNIAGNSIPFTLTTNGVSLNYNTNGQFWISNTVSGQSLYWNTNGSLYLNGVQVSPNGGSATNYTGVLNVTNLPSWVAYCSSNNVFSGTNTFNNLVSLIAGFQTGGFSIAATTNAVLFSGFGTTTANGLCYALSATSLTNPVTGAQVTYSGGTWSLLNTSGQTMYTSSTLTNAAWTKSTYGSNPVGVSTYAAASSGALLLGGTVVFTNLTGSANLTGTFTGSGDGLTVQGSNVAGILSINTTGNAATATSATGANTATNGSGTGTILLTTDTRGFTNTGIVNLTNDLSVFGGSNLLNQIYNIVAAVTNSALSATVLSNRPAPTLAEIAAAGGNTNSYAGGTNVVLTTNGGIVYINSSGNGGSATNAILNNNGTGTNLTVYGTFTSTNMDDKIQTATNNLLGTVTNIAKSYSSYTNLQAIAVFTTVTTNLSSGRVTIYNTNINDSCSFSLNRDAGTNFNQTALNEVKAWRTNNCATFVSSDVADTNTVTITILPNLLYQWGKSAAQPITNSLQYAFPHNLGRNPSVAIVHLLCVIQDDNTGLLPGAEKNWDDVVKADQSYDVWWDTTNIYLSVSANMLNNLTNYSIVPAHGGLAQNPSSWANFNLLTVFQ